MAKSIISYLAIAFLLCDVTYGWIRFRFPVSRREYLQQTAIEKLQNCGGKQECGVCGEGPGELLTEIISLSDFTRLGASNLAGGILSAEIGFRSGLGTRVEFRLCHLTKNATKDAEICNRTSPLWIQNEAVVAGNEALTGNEALNRNEAVFRPNDLQTHATIRLRVDPAEICEKCVIQAKYIPGPFSQKKGIFYDCALVVINPTLLNVAQPTASAIHDLLPNKEFVVDGQITNLGTLVSTKTTISSEQRARPFENTVQNLGKIGIFRSNNGQTRSMDTNIAEETSGVVEGNLRSSEIIVNTTKRALIGTGNDKVAMTAVVGKHTITRSSGNSNVAAIDTKSSISGNNALESTTGIYNDTFYYYYDDVGANETTLQNASTINTNASIINTRNRQDTNLLNETFTLIESNATTNRETDLYTTVLNPDGTRQRVITGRVDQEIVKVPSNIIVLPVSSLNTDYNQEVIDVNITSLESTLLAADQLRAAAKGQSLVNSATSVTSTDPRTSNSRSDAVSSINVLSSSNRASSNNVGTGHTTVVETSTRNEGSDSRVNNGNVWRTSTTIRNTTTLVSGQPGSSVTSSGGRITSNMDINAITTDVSGTETNIATDNSAVTGTGEFNTVRDYSAVTSTGEFNKVTDNSAVTRTRELNILTDNSAVTRTGEFNSVTDNSAVTSTGEFNTVGSGFSSTFGGPSTNTVNSRNILNSGDQSSGTVTVITDGSSINGENTGSIVASGSTSNSEFLNAGSSSSSTSTQIDTSGTVSSSSNTISGSATNNVQNVQAVNVQPGVNVQSPTDGEQNYTITITRTITYVTDEHGNEVPQSVVTNVDVEKEAAAEKARIAAAAAATGVNASREASMVVDGLVNSNNVFTKTDTTQTFTSNTQNNGFVTSAESPETSGPVLVTNVASSDSGAAFVNTIDESRTSTLDTDINTLTTVTGSAEIDTNVGRTLGVEPNAEITVVANTINPGVLNSSSSIADVNRDVVINVDRNKNTETNIIVGQTAADVTSNREVNIDATKTVDVTRSGSASVIGADASAVASRDSNVNVAISRGNTGGSNINRDITVTRDSNLNVDTNRLGTQNNINRETTVFRDANLNVDHNIVNMGTIINRDLAITRNTHFNRDSSRSDIANNINRQTSITRDTISNVDSRRANMGNTDNRDVGFTRDIDASRTIIGTSNPVLSTRNTRNEAWGGDGTRSIPFTVFENLKRSTNVVNNQDVSLDTSRIVNITQASSNTGQNRDTSINVETTKTGIINVGNTPLVDASNKVNRNISWEVTRIVDATGSRSDAGGDRGLMVSSNADVTRDTTLNIGSSRTGTINTVDTQNEINRDIISEVSRNINASRSTNILQTVVTNDTTRDTVVNADNTGTGTLTVFNSQDNTGDAQVNVDVNRSTSADRTVVRSDRVDTMVPNQFDSTNIVSINRTVIVSRDSNVIADTQNAPDTVVTEFVPANDVRSSTVDSSNFVSGSNTDQLTVGRTVSQIVDSNINTVAPVIDMTYTTDQSVALLTDAIPTTVMPIVTNRVAPSQTTVEDVGSSTIASVTPRKAFVASTSSTDNYFIYATSKTPAESGSQVNFFQDETAAVDRLGGIPIDIGMTQGRTVDKTILNNKTDSGIRQNVVGQYDLSQMFEVMTTVTDNKIPTANTVNRTTVQRVATQNREANKDANVIRTNDVVQSPMNVGVGSITTSNLTTSIHEAGPVTSTKVNVLDETGNVNVAERRNDNTVFDQTRNVNVVERRNDNTVFDHLMNTIRDQGVNRGEQITRETGSRDTKEVKVRTEWQPGKEVFDLTNTLIRSDNGASGVASEDLSVSNMGSWDTSRSTNVIGTGNDRSESVHRNNVNLLGTNIVRSDIGLFDGSVFNRIIPSDSFSLVSSTSELNEQRQGKQGQFTRPVRIREGNRDDTRFVQVKTTETRKPAPINLDIALNGAAGVNKVVFHKEEKEESLDSVAHRAPDVMPPIVVAQAARKRESSPGRNSRTIAGTIDRRVGSWGDNEGLIWGDMMSRNDVTRVGWANVGQASGSQEIKKSALNETSIWDINRLGDAKDKVTAVGRMEVISNTPIDTSNMNTQRSIDDFNWRRLQEPTLINTQNVDSNVIYKVDSTNTLANTGTNVNNQVLKTLEALMLEMKAREFSGDRRDVIYDSERSIATMHKPKLREDTRTNSVFTVSSWSDLNSGLTPTVLGRGTSEQNVNVNTVSSTVSEPTYSVGTGVVLDLQGAVSGIDDTTSTSSNRIVNREFVSEGVRKSEVTADGLSRPTKIDQSIIRPRGTTEARHNNLIESLSNQFAAVSSGRSQASLRNDPISEQALTPKAGTKRTLSQSIQRNIDVTGTGTVGTVVEPSIDSATNQDMVNLQDTAVKESAINQRTQTIVRTTEGEIRNPFQGIGGIRRVANFTRLSEINVPDVTVARPIDVLGADSTHTLVESSVNVGGTVVKPLVSIETVGDKTVGALNNVNVDRVVSVVRPAVSLETDGAKTVTTNNVNDSSRVTTLVRPAVIVADDSLKTSGSNNVNSNANSNNFNNDLISIEGKYFVGQMRRNELGAFEPVPMASDISNSVVEMPPSIGNVGGLDASASGMDFTASMAATNNDGNVIHATNSVRDAQGWANRNGNMVETEKLAVRPIVSENIAVRPAATVTRDSVIVNPGRKDTGADTGITSTGVVNTSVLNTRDIQLPFYTQDELLRAYNQQSRSTDSATDPSQAIFIGQNELLKQFGIQVDDNRMPRNSQLNVLAALKYNMSADGGYDNMNCRKGTVLVCHAVGITQYVPGMVWWCFSHCKNGICPPEKCQCSCEPMQDEYLALATEPSITNVENQAASSGRRQKGTKIIKLTLNGSEEHVAPAKDAIVTVKKESRDMKSVTNSGTQTSRTSAVFADEMTQITGSSNTLQPTDTVRNANQQLPGALGSGDAFTSRRSETIIEGPRSAVGTMDTVSTITNDGRNVNGSGRQTFGATRDSGSSNLTGRIATLNIDFGQRASPETLVCKGINAFSVTDGIDAWCTRLCRQNMCPIDICRCT